MASSAIIAISIILSILALILLIILCMNLFCLWQSRELYDPSKDDAERNANEKKSLKTVCTRSSHFQIRIYVAWLPRLKKFNRAWKNLSDFTLRPCWFSACCFCQRLEENENFLDEVFIPPSVIVAPASSKLDKRPSTLPVMTVSGSSGDTLSVTNPTGMSPRRGSMPKLSILAPDPIVLPMDRNSSMFQVPIQEDTEPIDFYAYQLDGKAGDRMLY